MYGSERIRTGSFVVSQTTDSRGRGSDGARTESQGSLTCPLSGKDSEQNLGTRSGAGVRSLEPRTRAQAWGILNIKLNQWLMDQPEIAKEALNTSLLKSSQKQTGLETLLGPTIVPRARGK